MSDEKERARRQAAESDPGSGPEVEAEPAPDPPELRDFLERSPARLLVEALLGAAAGTLLAGALRPEDAPTLAFAVAGSITAPLALLLTPISGPVPYRALRYGTALAVLGVLLVSFTAGLEGVRLEELVALGILLLGIGAVGHGAMVTFLPDHG
jgi:hypothetical protein